MKIEKKKIYITAVVAIGILGSVVIFGGNSDTTNNSVPVAVQPTSRQTIESSIKAQGEVFLLDSDVAFVNNTLEVGEILVRENDVVVQGQPLIRFNTNTRDREIEREKLEIQLREAQLNLQSAEVTLANTRIPPTDAELEQARLKVTQAEQGITNAEFALSQVDINIAQQHRSIEQQNRVIEQQQRKVEQLERGIEQKQNALEDARKTLSNTEVLFGVGAATQIELDNAVRAVELAENDVRNTENEISNANSSIQDAISEIANREERLITLDSDRTRAEQDIFVAHDNLELAKIQYNEIENRLSNPQTVNSIAQQEINVEKMRLNIEKIQNDIKNLNNIEDVLLSPISGTVRNINVSRGEITAPGRALIEISDAEEYVLRAFVNERHASNIRVGQQVLIEGSILGDEIVYGSISSVGTVAQSNQVGTNTEIVVPVEIRLDQEGYGNLFIPGTTLDFTVITETKDDVITVPILSVVTQKEGDSYVFVVNSDNVLEQRQVELGVFADMSAEVVSGLSEGDIIVIQPTNFMAEGLEITPMGL